MQLMLCTLSAKRRELIESDEALVGDVLMSDPREVPGLHRVGKAWDALRRVVEPWDRDGKLGALFKADGGRAIGKTLAFGKARVYEPAEVKVLAEIAETVPPDATEQRMKALRGVAVHGEFFTAGDEEDGGETAEALDRVLDDVRGLLARAAAKGESLLACVV